MKDERKFKEVIHSRKSAEKDSFATEIISEMKRQRDIWRIVAIISIVLNIIQWTF